MPTYQYACTECGHQLEAVQAFSDAALTDCPECSGRLRKVFSAVGVVFKGSGFYRTDSRSGSKEPSGTSEKTKGDSGGTDSGGKGSDTSSSTSDSSKSSGSGSSSGSSSTGSGGTGSGSNGSSSASSKVASKTAS